MARPGVTYQEVTNAATQLLAQGINPTIESIRRLTGTGSNGTLATHLRKWKETQTASYQVVSKENLPDELIACIKGLWERVVSESAERFIIIEEKITSENTALNEELEKYKNNNQRWQKLFNQWQQEKSQFANEKITLEQALTFIQQENASLQAKHDALFQQAAEKQERINELNRLHQQAQTNLEHYRESAREQRLLEQQRYEQQQQQLEQTIRELQQQLLLISQDKSLLQQQNDKFIFENNAMQAEYAIVKNKLDKQQEQFSTLKNELSEALQLKNYTHGQLQHLQNELTNKNHSYLESHKTNTVLLLQLESAGKQLKELHEQNKLLALEKWTLGQEKSQLEGQLKQMDKFLKHSTKVPA